LQLAGREAPPWQGRRLQSPPAIPISARCIRFFAFLASALSRFFFSQFVRRANACSITQINAADRLKAALSSTANRKRSCLTAWSLSKATPLPPPGATSIPDNAQIIDLGDATLSPGFMDAHTHLTSDFSGNYNERRLRMLDENISQLALEMIPNAKATIEAGFTSVRDVGSGFPNSHDFPTSPPQRNQQRPHPGPRMLVATHGIGATGGLRRHERISRHAFRGRTGLD
jgi:hypothetical protein